MAQHRIRRLPVVEGEMLVGVLSQADVALEAKDSRDRRPRPGDLAADVDGSRVNDRCQASSKPSIAASTRPGSVARL